MVIFSKHFVHVKICLELMNYLIGITIDYN